MSLHEVIAAEARRPAGFDLTPLLVVLKQRFGDDLLGVMFYGSCRRLGLSMMAESTSSPISSDSQSGSHVLADAVIDLYAVLRKRRPSEPRLTAVLGHWLPPNVYFIEAPHRGATLRAKVGVFAIDELARACASFESYVWARWAQPMSLVYSANADVEARVIDLQARSVQRFVDLVFPLNDGHEVLAAWADGLARSYRTELRPEVGGRAEQLLSAELGYYRAVSRAARGAWLRCDAEVTTIDIYSVRTGAPARAAPLARLRWAWRLRTWVGKFRSLLRLLKGLYTFEGALDYAAWKLSRHAGRPIEIPARVRRWPLIFVWPLIVRLYRQGVLR